MSATTTETPETTTSAAQRASRAWTAVRRTLRLAREASPRTFAFVAIGTFVAAFAGPCVIFATGALIDGVVRSQAAKGDVDLFGDARLWGPLLLLAVAVFVHRALDRFLDRSWEVYADAVHLEIKVRTLQAVTSADAAVVEDPKFYDTLQRAQADSTWRPHAMIVTCIHIFSSTTSLLALFSALAVLHPVLLLLGLLSVVPVLLVRAGVNEKIWRVFARAGAREREHNYLFHLTGEPRFHAEQKAFGLASTLIGRVRQLSQSRLDDKRRLYQEANGRDVVGAAVSAAVLAVAYGFLITRGGGGDLSVGDVAASLSAFSSMTGHLAAMLGALLTVDQHAPFLLDLYSLYDRPQALSTSTSPQPLAPRLTTLALESVSFSYPSSSSPVIDGVSLTLRRGEKVAIVGENGAGKSTLVKLLLRFFDPQQGRVVVDGVDVKDVDAVALRQRIGVLFQEYERFQLPLRRGIGYGRAEVEFDEARANAAVDAARARAVVDELGGLDGVAGRVLEGGHDLSGGQWQRLALARLLYRDADVWILDEPTANLDPGAEAAVFDELFHLARDRAVLVISHRFATVRACDRIVVLDGGRVVEEGSHDALIALDGRYARLFALQAKAFV